LAQALLGLGRYPEAAEAFDAYLKAGGRPVADVHRGRGLARMRQGDYLGACDDYTRVLETEPGAEIYRHRGWAYFFADAWRPALRDFGEAVRLDSKDADAYAGRGLARVMLGQYREAVADAEESLRCRPATPEMMHNLACLYAQAVARVEADAKASDRAALTDRYRASAVRAIRRTLAMVRPEDRAAFWRDKILPDSALNPIRESSEFRKLQREQDAGPDEEASTPAHSARILSDRRFIRDKGLREDSTATPIEGPLPADLFVLRVAGPALPSGAQGLRLTRSGGRANHVAFLILSSAWRRSEGYVGATVVPRRTPFYRQDLFAVPGSP